MKEYVDQTMTHGKDIERWYVFDEDLVLAKEEPFLSEAGAIKEAEALALADPGKNFHVLTWRGSCSISKPSVWWTKP